MYSENSSTFWGGVVNDALCKWATLESCAIALKALVKKDNTWEYSLRALELTQMYQLLYVDLQKCISDQMWESVTDLLANWNSDMRTWHNQQTCHEMLNGILICHPWLLVTFLCKSLVFGFVDTDLFCYFDNVYNPQIKCISKYLRPMVIHCKKLDQILFILWADIHNLSQILHCPGNVSTWIKEGYS